MTKNTPDIIVGLTLAFLIVWLVWDSLRLNQVEKLVGLTPEIPDSQIFCKEIMDISFLEPYCQFNSTGLSYCIECNPNYDFEKCLPTEYYANGSILVPFKEVCYRIPIIEQTYKRYVGFKPMDD